MPSSENKIMLTTQTEKPSHYRYLKEFRVEQCPLFPQHKCTQHRPFSCFNWHFPNQKRRRPIRKKDGTFNYSPDAYCTKYDETNGVCPDGDDCPLLHRTAGDTERRYHLRYFKTCMCIYETDTRGFCTKNGAHCAFAHGEIDKRPPVFDIRELQQMQAAEQPLQELQDPVLINGPNQLDKERNMMVDDPKWQDANYVLIHYKTESCKRPPRLCRQGYACPQYHNLRDRRRSPKIHKYRSTPCPNVKHGDEWGEPTQCEDGDECAYCHTRTEQQFHPEIYKSSKCHDVFANQYCPRGPFCAFAHADHEMTINRNLPTDTNFGEILSNALPNSLGNGNNGGMEESNNNFINIQGLNNNSNNVDIFNMASINNLLAKNNGGGSDMSDMRGSPDSISQFQQLMGGTSTNSASFGNQSFASAVSYSAAAGNNNINLSKLFGETSGDKSGMDDLNNLSNGLARSIGNRINHMSGNNFNMTSSTLFENLDNFMNFEQDREMYSLFPSMSASSKNPREESRDDSPNAEKENADGSEFGSSDISLASGASSKPVSIPGSFFPRERFPSGSPLTKTLNTINNPLGSFFKNQESLEQSTDVMNNHLGWEFSPRSLTMSPLTNNSGFNIVQQQQQQQTSSGTLGALTSITSSTSNNNNISGGGGMNNGSNSNNINVAPIGSNNNNGGGSSGIISDSNNGLISSASNNSTSSIVSANGTMINILGRSDLSYISLSLLNQYAKAFREQLDAINNAITSYNKDSPHYPCLNCKIKDKARTIVLVPCDHQVLCVNCAPNVNYCPLCRTVIRNRKQASITTSEL